MLPTPVNNAAAQPGTDNSTNNNRQNKGTGFTNIGSVLNANKGAGEKIGQAVGGSIAGQANSVKAGIQSSQDQFNTDKNAATTQATNAVQAGAQYARQAGEDDNTYTQRVSGATDDLSNVGKNLSTAAYNGPTTLNNAEQLGSQAANVTALGRLAGTADGQAQLIRSQVAQKGPYSQGQNSLDSLLLGNSGQQYLQPARSQAAQVSSQASNALLNSTAQANAAKSAIDTNRTNALQGLQNSLTGDGSTDAGGITGLQTLASKQATDYTNNAQRLQALLAGKDAQGNLIKGSSITDADKALLQHMGDYGVNNGSLYTDPNDPSSWQSALGNYASNLTTQGLGNQMYTDPQRSAATNLAKLLQDNQSAQSIAGQTFNKDIQSDTQASQAQSALDNLKGGINGNISAAQNKAAGLQALMDQYAGYDNVAGLVKNGGGIVGGVQDLDKRFSALTGKSFLQQSEAAGDKRISSILNQYLNPTNQEVSSLNNQLNSNTTSVYDAALKRLLGQQ